jgi:hypothetical protein
MLVDTDDEFELPAAASDAQISSEEDEQPSDKQPLFG